MIRILLADDHAVVRKGLRQIVEEDTGMKVTGEAQNGEEALSLVRSLSFDVVILDISMPGRGGLDVLRDLKAEQQAPKVIVLSMHPEEQYAIRCLRDGASGYLTKNCPPEELLLAVRMVSEGKRYITPSVAERLASYIEDNVQVAPHERLSNRELQVLRLVASGKLLTDIAAALNLSVKTVSTYRARILGKMGMETTAQLIRYAIQHGLAD
jgi:two-component system, NarL family, invasion response regulator UvrY